MNKKAKIPAFAGMTILFLFFFSLSHSLIFAQDTVKAKTDTISYKPLTFILSDHKYSYINPTNPDTVTRKRFLWYPTKVLEDVFNYIPGYYLRYMDVGQVNQLMFNQFDQYHTGVLRHGRPINDMLDGSIDFNILSRNEIDQVEVSEGYMNNVYSYSNTVNLLQRQLFVNRAYTEISFFQDRYENLYFDGNFHQNLFRNLNFNFGITKHSYDGKYDNSGFDKWLGRFNLNFAASNKLNFFAYVNYADIKRDLNEGLNPDTIDLTNKDEVFDPAIAIVMFEKGDENKERFDIDIGAVFKPSEKSYTKIQLYEGNSIRRVHQLSNTVDPFSPLVKSTYHWINYGAKLQQIFNFKLNNNSLLSSKTELEYSYLTMESGSQNDVFSLKRKEQDIYLLEDVSLSYKNIVLSAFVSGWLSKNNSENFTDDPYSSVGARITYNYKIDSTTLLSGSLLYNRPNNYIAASGNFRSKNFDARVSFYTYKHYDYRNTLVLTEKINFKGINASLRLKLFKFVINADYSYNFRNAYNDILPINSGRASVFFEDNAIRNKLEYKIGFTSRYWSKHKAVYYSATGNRFTDYYIGNTIVNYGRNTGEIPENATLDFFIMGRIGRATFGLTLENILDRIIYNTGVYPYMDRGGFVNAISRFNITWNFTD